MIIEQHINTIRKTVDYLLLSSELKQTQQKRKEKLTENQTTNISKKYSFFHTSAQKVLTKHLYNTITSLIPLNRDNGKYPIN